MDNSNTNQENKNNKGIDLSDEFKDFDVSVKISDNQSTEKKQINYVLVGLIVVIVVVTLVAIFGFSRKQTTSPIEQHINQPQFLPNQ